jgi:hypothetical protein
VPLAELQLAEADQELYAKLQAGGLLYYRGGDFEDVKAEQATKVNTWKMMRSEREPAADEHCKRLRLA